MRRDFDVGIGKLNAQTKPPDRLEQSIAPLSRPNVYGGPVVEWVKRPRPDPQLAPHSGGRTAFACLTTSFDSI